MTRLLARIALAILVIPVAAIVYFVAFVLFNETDIEYRFAFLWAGTVTAVFVSCSWLSIWRSWVRWTWWRKWGTLLLAPASLATAGMLGILGESGLRFPDWSFVAFVTSTLGILFWLASTILLWKETSAERLQRTSQSLADAIFCPQCGYNLKGLHQATCPECGARFTLNELFAAQQREQLADATTE